MNAFCFTSLIRRRGRFKVQSADCHPDEELLPHSAELIPNLTFIANLNGRLSQHAKVESCALRVDRKDLPKTLKAKDAIEMDTMKTGTHSSDDQSIEEEIEEAVSAGSSTGISEARGGNEFLFRPQLREETPSKSTVSHQNLQDSSQKLSRSNQEDDGMFGIDDDQLSGRELAQHFVIESSEKSKEVVQKNDETFNKLLSDEANQSTANDVSEINDEVSDELRQTVSLPIRSSLPEVIPKPRECRSLDTSTSLTTQDETSLESMHSEKDNSVGEEVVYVTPTKEKLVESKTNQSPEKVSSDKSHKECKDGHDDDDDDIEEFKHRIMQIKHQPKVSHLDHQADQPQIAVKQMERMSGEFNKDALEDITEESEKLSSTSCTLEKSKFTGDEAPPVSPHVLPTTSLKEKTPSAANLEMMQLLENKVTELKQVAEMKDACLTSPTTQPDSANHREPPSNDQPQSGRDSTSLVTSSTEYRTLQEDLGCATMDFYVELSKKNEMINKLTESLQQSLQIRENLQAEGDKLTNEVQQLRKQLTELLERVRPSFWPRDQESSGQRISEISIDLVGESDDDLDRQSFTDNEDKNSRYSRNSRERQLSLPRTSDAFDFASLEVQPVSKQIEQFQKYLTSHEPGSSYLTQKSDDFSSQELDKVRTKYENEIKILNERLEAEKTTKNAEIARLRQLLNSVKTGSTELIELRREMDSMHAKEMENLRQYFEKKCADLEKQYSEEIFSQKSQRQDDSSSDLSDQDLMPEDEPLRKPKLSSPKKKTKAELLSSPSYRQLTPSIYDMGASSDAAHLDANPNDLKSNPEEMKIFYQTKMNELKTNHESTIRKLTERLKHYESKFTEDDFMALLSENTSDDNNWPPELILLREKFTAKSQLEIAQLQIKHEEEMARVKAENNRKMKRHSAFDLCRDLDQEMSERNEWRELSKALRKTLADVIRYMNIREDDLNATLADEVQQALNRTLDGDENEITIPLSAQIPLKKLHYSLNVSGLLSVVDDPKLISFMSNKTNTSDLEGFDLKECLERLKAEAAHLLELSEDVRKRREDRKTSESSGAEKVDSCEEDGLKRYAFTRTNSLNEIVWKQPNKAFVQQHLSLPPDLNRFHQLNDSVDDFTASTGASELNFHFNELKNRLVKSENERMRLEQEVEHSHQRNSELEAELNKLKNFLQNLGHHENYQGYGLGLIKSPRRIEEENAVKSFSQLQEKARHLLSSPTQQPNETTSNLLQLIEDFCREGDKVFECGKKDRDDLQAQIDTADKQLKATRKFLEDQAAERELERDEFLREIEKLQKQIRDKEKERNSFENASKEVDNLEQQIKDYSQKLVECSAKKDKFELELKASIDKIFVLREIISDLETQVKTNELNEHVLGEKIKELEMYIDSQTSINEGLQQEMHKMKMEIGSGYAEKIRQLEEKLRNDQSSTEQGTVIKQIVEQLRDVETTLEQKTKNLESLHHSSSSISSNSNPIEDVSVQGKSPAMASAIISPPQGSPIHPSPHPQVLPLECLRRVLEKLSKHTRMEEAAVKRIHDLEMQISNIRGSCLELQHERDSLQEKMSEQMQRISALQLRLEEQRHRAEELQRQGSSDLNIRIHDLQNEVHNLKETLEVRDKQVATLRNQLEKSKSAIDRLEAEIAVHSHSDRSSIERLEAELNARNAENQRLKEKIKTEMINKLALPDLMETMLADKNDEIDHLKEQLEVKDKELQGLLELNLSDGTNKARNDGAQSGKISERTLSDVVTFSDFDEPDVVRRAVPQIETPPKILPQSSIQTSKEVVANLSDKRLDDLTGFNSLYPEKTFDHPHYFQDPSVMVNKSGNTSAQQMIPRQINFSELSDNSRVKDSTPKIPEESKESHNIVMENLKTLQNQLNEVTAERDQINTEKSAEITQLSKQLAGSTDQIKNLKSETAELYKEVAGLKINLQKRQDEYNLLEEELVAAQLRLGGTQDDLQKMNENEQRLQEELTAKVAQIEALEEDAQRKSKLLSKHEKNLHNYRKNEEKHLQLIADLESRIHSLSEKAKSEEDLSNQLELAQQELRDKIKLYEACLLDISDYKQQIANLNSVISSRDIRIEEQLSKIIAQESRIEELQERCDALEKDLEKVRSQSSESSKPFSVDEITKKVETELNYSAQLDSNILKAIESEEENNFDVHTKSDNEKIVERDLLNQLEALRVQLELERANNDELRKELVLEKQHSQEIQEQDVAIIEAMRSRLEMSLNKEDELHKALDQERDKCERLITQITVLQRSEARKCSLGLKSPTESPRKFQYSYESDLADRLKSEIKLLTSQVDREKERVVDVQRSLERERNRFDTALKDRIEYSDRLKKEMEKVARDKDIAEQEVEHLQERVSLQSQEIESLEARIAALQEAETRRINRRDRQRAENTQTAVEIHDLKAKILSLETERDHLNQTIALLQYNVDCGAQREAKLAEALSNTNSEASIPQQFMQKMKEINNLLSENTKENRQMSETVQFLVEERRALQKKCEELESQVGSNVNVAELEEHANHLLGRYLRVESHRKALVYQKRYLKVSLQSYQDNEARLMAHLQRDFDCTPPAKKLRFKTVAIAIIAIQRMKFIRRLWFTGKRFVSKSVFTITQQKRPPNNPPAVSSSPPSRDTGTQYIPFTLTEIPAARPLQAPGIIANTQQKFDWSRIQHRRPKNNKKTSPAVPSSETAGAFE